MNGYALQCLFILSIDFHDGVNDLNVSANESIFPLLYASQIGVVYLLQVIC